jgi:hypothetical protein
MVQTGRVWYSVFQCIPVSFNQFHTKWSVIIDLVVFKLMFLNIGPGLRNEDFPL